MKKILLGISISFLLLFIRDPIKTSALTFEKLHLSQSSQQWKVEIGNEPGRPIPIKPPVRSNEYIITVQNIGDKNIELERVEVYRDGPNSRTKNELFTLYKDRSETLRTPLTVHHVEHLPVSLSAKKLEVILTWSEKGKEEKYDRRYQQTFVFEAK